MKIFNYKDVGKDYAKDYENLERKHKIYSESSRKLVDLANIQENNTIIDLGCGTGISSIEIYKRIKNKGKLIGIDISPAMLEIAKRKFQRKNNVKFILGNGYNLSNLVNEDVNVVLSNFSYYYFVSNLKPLFEQVYDTLKQKGKYVFNITSYFTPLHFKGKEYNKFGRILFEEADKVLKAKGYDRVGKFTIDLSLVDNCNKVSDLLKKVGFSSINYRLSGLPITPEQTLDFTYEGFFKYGSKISFSTALSEISFEKRIKFIEEIISKTKQRFRKEKIKEIPKVFDILAKK